MGGITSVYINTNYFFSVTSEVGKWLNRFDLGLYESYLLANGFDDLDFLVSYEVKPQQQSKELENTNSSRHILMLIADCIFVSNLFIQHDTCSTEYF